MRNHLRAGLAAIGLCVVMLSLVGCGEDKDESKNVSTTFVTNFTDIDENDLDALDKGMQDLEGDIGQLDNAYNSAGEDQ